MLRIHQQLGLSFRAADNDIRQNFRAFRNKCIELIEEKVSLKDFVEYCGTNFVVNHALKNEMLSKEQFVELLKKAGGLS
ncbi:MAG: hypothetical protein ACK5Z5_06405 [Neisseriaceae bacterium]